MNPPNCIKCELKPSGGTKVRRYGKYYRTSDSTWVQRFQCSECKSTVSKARFSLSYRQKKRRKNRQLVELLCSGVSQRRAAKLLRINRKTVVRIFRLESLNAEYRMRVQNLRSPKATCIEFDDLETIEHTKCKPVSVTLAVETGSRRILGLTVSRMAAKGRLSEKSRSLYGKRNDRRRAGRNLLFKRIKPLLASGALIKSDENPHYVDSVKFHFPKSQHQAFKGVRGSTTGQGEIKKVGFDPLFSLNHTCAMLRANVNRLFRKTWCTTKCLRHLHAHLVLYADYHNTFLIKPKPA